jgi:hypothetical protein
VTRLPIVQYPSIVVDNLPYFTRVWAHQCSDDRGDDNVVSDVLAVGLVVAPQAHPLPLPAPA